LSTNTADYIVGNVLVH